MVMDAERCLTMIDNAVRMTIWFGLIFDVSI